MIRTINIYFALLISFFLCRGREGGLFTLFVLTNDIIFILKNSRTDDLGGNRRMRMAAPKIGNTEMPPEDGFTWRKYGQKEILNAKYPR